MNINPKQLEQMMKKMGIQQQEVDAKKVIIELPDKKIILVGPTVSKVNAMGQETWQVVGGEQYEEKNSPEKIKIDEDDVKTVMEQTGASEKVVKKILEETNGDLAEAILKLKND